MNKKHLSFCLFFFSIVVFSCTKQSGQETRTSRQTPEITVPIRIENSLTENNREQVTSYVKKLFAARPSMQRYINEIEYLRPTLTTGLGEYDYVYSDYGWTSEIYVEIRLKDKTSLPPEWRADRQTLHYILGSGHTPGVIAKKTVSQRFADMPIVESGDSFMALPSMTGIDEIAD